MIALLQRQHRLAACRSVMLSGHLPPTHTQTEQWDRVCSQGYKARPLFACAFQCGDSCSRKEQGSHSCSGKISRRPLVLLLSSYYSALDQTQPFFEHPLENGNNGLLARLATGIEWPPSQGIHSEAADWGSHQGHGEHPKVRDHGTVPRGLLTQTGPSCDDKRCQEWAGPWLRLTLPWVLAVWSGRPHPL